jgi:pimeloyl-ACP methyl ester carboxylesterase
VLTNGSVILERASLRPSQKILRGPLGPLFSRLSNERGFTRGFARLFSAAHPLSAQEAQAQWALMARDDGQRILHLLCAYLDERVRFAQRWHGAVRDWSKPLSFLWATGDPVATTEVLAGLTELRPAAEVIRLPGIGHYPQIEVPDEFTAGVRTLLQLD